MSPPPDEHTRPWNRKQLLLKLGVFLLLGAIVNVAVAWGIALKPEVPWAFAPEVPRRDLTWPIDRLDEISGNPTFVATTETVGFIRSEYSLSQDTAGAIQRFRQLTSDEGQIAVLDRVQIGEPGFFVLRETVTGWPAVAMSGYEWEITLGSTQYDVLRFALAVESRPVTITLSMSYFGGGPSGPPSVTLTQTRLLPLRPLWLGFAVNTTFYAALLWVLFCAPGKFRRLVRTRRGCCPACGYQIATGVGDKCSECGAVLLQVLRT